jgi:hypothetical protein
MIPPQTQRWMAELRRKKMKLRYVAPLAIAASAAAIGLAPIAAADTTVHLGPRVR